MAHSFPVKTNWTENVWAVFAALLSISASLSAASNPPNGRDLIAKSLDAGERNELQLRSYVSRTYSDLKQLAQDGSIKSEETKTFEDIVVDGFHVRSLAAKNGKPLTQQDRQKEESRVAKLVALRKAESPQAREKRLTEAKDKSEKDRRFTHELLNAFDYSVMGEETVEGRKAWVVNATPHPGYEPKELKAQMLPHLRGRLWIDKEDLLWAKAEAEVVEQFGIGFSVIAKINPGGHLSLEQARQPDGVWVVRKVEFKGSGRVALVKHFSVDSLTTSTDFRKVPADRRIGDGKEEF